MIDITAKLRRIAINRADMARRWHRMNREQAVAFVKDDPDVLAQFDNPVVRNAAVDEALSMLIEEVLDGINVEAHRRRFGDALIDVRHHGRAHGHARRRPEWIEKGGRNRRLTELHRSIFHPIWRSFGHRFERPARCSRRAEKGANPY